jgi:hypothetical protein
MVGCMTETSCGISAAALLAPLCAITPTLTVVGSSETTLSRCPNWKLVKFAKVVWLFDGFELFEWFDGLD